MSSPSSDIHSKVIILGSGPAGATAAIYAARAMLEPTLIAGLQPGGQLTITTEVENYPGFAEAIQGPWLMEQMQAQAEHVGTKLVQDTIASVDLARRPFTLIGDSGDRYLADTLIVATGASANWLGLPSEEKFKGFGVSACATCDGFFFRGKNVAVVGGGNTAAEEALYLTNFAEKVTLIHRRDQLRCDKTNQSRLAANAKIEILYDSVVEDVRGTEQPLSVTGIRVRNVKTNAEHNLDVDGLFVAIGHSPATDLFKGQLDMDEFGYILTAPDFDAHIRRRRVRGRRCQGQGVPPSRHRCRHGLHGSPRSRTFSGGQSPPRLAPEGSAWTGTSCVSSTPWPRRGVSPMPARC